MNTEEANVIEAEDVATTPVPPDDAAVEAPAEETGSDVAVEEPDVAKEAVAVDSEGADVDEDTPDTDTVADDAEVEAVADAEVEAVTDAEVEAVADDAEVEAVADAEVEAVAEVEATDIDLSESVSDETAVSEQAPSGDEADPAGDIEMAAADDVADVAQTGDTVSGEVLDEGISSDEPVEDEGPDRSNMDWYVVHTYSGYENRAKQCLLDRITSLGHEEMFGDILIPVENVVEMKKGSKRTSTRKFFPGYMLVQMEMSNETWHLVKDTQKITGFVGGTAGKPKSVPMREVKRITDQMVDGAERPKAKQTFEEGAQVRVTDGPFLNFTGTVEEVRPDKQKLRVLVSIFGRATPLELDFIQVERM
jgi:transcriptional antiterminator NusG